MTTEDQPLAESQRKTTHATSVNELHLISAEQWSVRVCAPPHEHEPVGADILLLAGHTPTSDQIVLQLLHEGGLESISLDERITLSRGNKFVLSSGDQMYRFTIDGKQYEWPHVKVTSDTLLRLAQKGDEFEIVQQLDDAPDRVLDNEDLVDLSHNGTEHFKTRKGSKQITVLYNEQPFELAKGTYTTEQLIFIFKVEPGYVLDLWVDGKLVEVKPEQKLKLKADMHFTSHPPRGQSS